MYTQQQIRNEMKSGINELATTEYRVNSSSSSIHTRKITHERAHTHATYIIYINKITNAYDESSL